MEKSRSCFIAEGWKPTNSLDSYRPISLTNVCCKVAAKMVECRLREFLKLKGAISDCQTGFRRHRSTMDQVVKLTQEIKDDFHQKQSTLAVLVDFKAAYDKVWRHIMLHKLKKQVVSGKLLHWVQSLVSLHSMVSKCHLSLETDASRLASGSSS
ncbi:putative RNA-directed DNA polymerase from transposon BS [Trichonephila clavipes]|nr:putative RNA-directed DNA polymerase from transposon BS [Trichonephila clavipes]